MIFKNFHAIREPTSGLYLKCSSILPAFLVGLDGEVVVYKSQGAAKAFARKAEKWYKYYHELYLKSDYSRHTKEELFQYRKPPVTLEIVPLELKPLPPVVY